MGNSDLERQDSNESTEGEGIIQGQIQLPSQHNESVNGEMEKVGSQVEETMDIPKEGIEKIIDRDEKLEDLSARADELKKKIHIYLTHLVETYVKKLSFNIIEIKQL